MSSNGFFLKHPLQNLGEQSEKERFLVLIRAKKMAELFTVCVTVSLQKQHKCMMTYRTQVREGRDKININKMKEWIIMKQI